MAGILQEWYDPGYAPSAPPTGLPTPPMPRAPFGPPAPPRRRVSPPHDPAWPVWPGRIQWTTTIVRADPPAASKCASSRAEMNGCTNEPRNTR